MTCYSCNGNTMLDPPPRELVFRSARWRVAHVFNSSLPGWLVVLPLRHVEALDELDDDELVELGLLQGRVSAALKQVVGCTKTYVAQFSEAAGFQHLHVHVVPRMADQPTDRIGPQVFAYIDQGEDAWVPLEEMDRIAREVGARVRLLTPPPD